MRVTVLVLSTARSRTTIFFLLLLSVFLTHSSVLADAQTCPDSDAANDNGGECQVATNDENLTEDDEREVSFGWNPLPARLAVVSGQITNLETCGEWCHNVSDSGTACRMDTDYVPCQGDYYCTTTCRLWEKNILMDPLNGFEAGKIVTERPVTSCAMFKRVEEYTSINTSEPCDISCLLPEFRSDRYPAPTGLGRMCQKGTCYPVSSSYAESAPARLECPCNWFGSDCKNDEYPIHSIRHTGVYGDMPGAITATTITVQMEHWFKIMEHHQPGGIIRITRRDDNDGRFREQHYVVAAANARQHTIEILTPPPTTTPDASLDIVARDVADRIRSLPLDNTVVLNPTNLYIHPSISGFFNSQQQFLIPAIEERKIQHLVVLSTGAGLGGSLSILSHILPTIGNKSPLNSVHLYHGVRSLEELPYQNKLHELATTNLGLQLIIVQSQMEYDYATDTATDRPKTIRQAVMRGDLSRQLLVGKTATSTISSEGSSGKVYVQHVLESDLTNSGVPLENTVFVACGRLALLEDSKDMLQKLYCQDDNDAECQSNLGTHFFTNI